MSEDGAPEASDVSAARPLQIGLYLTNQHPVGSDMVQALRGQIRLLHHARDHGWDSFWTGKHFLPIMPMTQPVPFLARLAAEAGEMRVGLGVLLLALANPLEVAETFASMDVVSGGRFTLGVGLGYWDVEYDGFGILSHERVRRLEENLKLGGGALGGRGGERRPPVVPAGRRNTQDPSGSATPASPVDGREQRSRRQAGRADGRHVDHQPPRHHVDDRTPLELFDGVRRELGRPPLTELPAIREVVCGRTRERALEMAKPYLTVKRFVIGTPDDCIRELLEWRNGLGVDHFIFRPFWSGMPVETALESMDLLSREVIPAVRER